MRVPVDGGGETLDGRVGIPAVLPPFSPEKHAGPRAFDNLEREAPRRIGSAKQPAPVIRMPLKREVCLVITDAVSFK